MATDEDGVELGLLLLVIVVILVEPRPARDGPLGQRLYGRRECGREARATPREVGHALGARLHRRDDEARDAWIVVGEAWVEEAGSPNPRAAGLDRATCGLTHVHAGPTRPALRRPRSPP